MLRAAFDLGGALPAPLAQSCDHALHQQLGRRGAGGHAHGALALEPLRPQAWPKGYWRRWGKASRGLDLIEPLLPGGKPIDLDEP